MSKIAKEPSFLKPAGDARGEKAADPEFEIAYRDSVGAVLRRAREGFGEDLGFVATALKIRHVYLAAIEEQRYEDLPGPTYAVGFIRTYAEYLGLDPNDMVRLFKEEVEGIDKRQELVFPTPAPETKVPGGAVILLSLLLVGAAYGGWSYFSQQPEQVAEVVPPVPEELRGLIKEEERQTAAATPMAAEDPATADVRDDATRTVAPTSTGSIATADRVPSETAPIAEATATTDASGEATAADDLPENTSAAEAVAAEPPESGEPAEALPPPMPAPRPSETAVNTEATAEDETEAAATDAAAEDAPAAETPSETVAAATPEARNQPAPPTPGTERVTLANVLNRGALGGAPASPAANEIPEAPQTTQLAALANEPPPQVYGQDNEDARIVLRARQDSFVQIRAEDELLMTRVLRRGDEYRVPNREGLTLLIGNAGGIEFVVDGASLRPLGPVGVVRRNVMLDPERLVDGTALLP